MASWVFCTPLAKSSVFVAMADASVDIPDNCSPIAPSAFPICPASGICSCDSAAFNSVSSVSNADRPVAKFFHCAAVRCISDGLPVGHVMTAPANGPIPGIALRNPSISHHFAGGVTIAPLGPVGASTAFVSLGSGPTEPMGPPPPMVDAASAFL